jgi:hypothetical protein
VKKRTSSKSDEDEKPHKSKREESPEHPKPKKIVRIVKKVVEEKPKEPVKTKIVRCQKAEVRTTKKPVEKPSPKRTRKRAMAFTHAMQEELENKIGEEVRKMEKLVPAKIQPICEFLYTFSRWAPGLPKAVLERMNTNLKTVANPIELPTLIMQHALLMEESDEDFIDDEPVEELEEVEEEPEGEEMEEVEEEQEEEEEEEVPPPSKKPALKKR